MSTEAWRDLQRLLLGPPVLRLAVAESVTGGRLQSMITAISGASQFFEGGITAYSLEQKVAHLGVDRAHAAEVGCVSDAVARQMALGATRLFGTELAVATTGFAEDPPAERGSCPFAYWALCHRQRDSAEVLSGRWDASHTRGRVHVQETLAAAVLVELVTYVSGWRARDG